MSLSTDISPQKQATPPEETPLLVYGCTPWRLSSQRVADLYDSGAKLWTKSDLTDIETQLEQSKTLDRFVIRCVDGSQVHVKNPIQGARTPIWKPYVVFQDYWKLVLGDTFDQPGTKYCSYRIDWKNYLAEDFRGNIEDWQRLFATKQRLWNESITCASFKAELQKVIRAHQHVNKVVCFGLGDMTRRPPETIALPPPLAGKQRQQQPEEESDGASVDRPMMQHAMAMTLADELGRRHDGGGDAVVVRLLAQDPRYGDDTKEFLKTRGFQIVGDFGAGGFQEVDDQSIVISCWTGAPIKQIIADLCRPVAIIILGDDGVVLNRFSRPYADGESPRTRQMWQGYDKWDFPVSSVEAELMTGFNPLKILVRRAGSEANASLA
ncbi:hypothetical protein GE09DRAFT_1116401 [Coniochaeta sp. 2T2.1]|nr:hypothetical protein GE09DRAFT_1116401 [Coniochaeta sp. 2T2.1]